MKRTPESGPHSALVRHPKLVAAAIGLAMLLIASAAQAAGRGSAQNPILLPGTETTLPRLAPSHVRRHVLLQHGALRATFYTLPTEPLLSGLRPHLAHDMVAVDEPARATFDAGGTADLDGGGSGIQLSLNPGLDLELEGHDVARGDPGNPAGAARTRGVYGTTLVGLEVRFMAPMTR